MPLARHPVSLQHAACQLTLAQGHRFARLGKSAMQFGRTSPGSDTDPFNIEPIEQLDSSKAVSIFDLNHYSRSRLVQRLLMIGGRTSCSVQVIISLAVLCGSACA